MKKPNFKQTTLSNLIPGTIKEYHKKWENRKSRIKICSPERNYPVLTDDWEPGKKKHNVCAKRDEDIHRRKRGNPKPQASVAHIRKNRELYYEIKSVN